MTGLCVPAISDVLMDLAILQHLVTLWLVGWSYSISLTMIGVSIFVSMDCSDVFLAVGIVNAQL